MFYLKAFLNLLSGLFLSKKIGPESIDKPKEEPKVKKGITICLDPGHGGSDPGAVHPKHDPIYLEAELALDICGALAYKLDDEGYEVILTRADNTSPISRAQRISRIKQAKADLLVSVHLNSFHKPAYGIETLYNSSNPKSMKLAKSIQLSLVGDFSDHKDRGIKVRNNLYVLKTMSPSVLVEVEFINTAGDFIETNVDNIALSIFNGVEEFLKD